MPKVTIKKLLNNTLSNRQHLLLLLSIYALGIFAFGLIILITQRIPGSDDFVFQEQIKPFATLLDWSTYRYETWSGRIFAESFVYIFSPLPLIFWKSASLVLYVLYSGFLFKYYVLFSKKRTQLKDYFMMALALTLPLLMDTRVLTEGMLWVTGSMNYFWLVSFAVIGFYPFFHYAVRYRLPHWVICALSTVSILIAASSQEQIGAVLAVLSLIFIGFIIFKKDEKQKIPYYLIFVTLLSIVVFVLAAKAPGNQERIAVETLVRLPDFHTVPIIDHIEYAYRWFLDSVINRFGLLLALVWALILGLFMHKKQSTKFDIFDWIVIVILSASATFLTLKGFNSVSHLFNFYPTWRVDAPKVSYLILVPWTIAILTTLFAPIVLYRTRIIGVIIALLYAAVLATTALITLSPTMYASGFRILFVPCILLLIIAYILFERLFEQKRGLATTLFVAVMLIGLSQYLLIIQNTIK